MTMRRTDRNAGLVLALLMSLTLLITPAALAHHKEGHDGGPEQSQGGGNDSSAGENSDNGGSNGGSQGNGGEPKGDSNGNGSKDNDGDADNDPGTSYDEDNDTNDGDTPNNVPDDGDNEHPSGKDKSEEKGKSGNQGKSESDPDGDSNGGKDKPNGSGGNDLADQDGNNGCGNDDDFEDDNNGNCGGKGKNQGPKTVTEPAQEAPGCSYTSPHADDDCQPEGPKDSPCGWTAPDHSCKTGNDHEPCDSDESMPGTQPCTPQSAPCDSDSTMPGVQPCDAEGNPCDADAEMEGTQPCSVSVPPCPEDMTSGEGECGSIDEGGQTEVLGSTLSRSGDGTAAAAPSVDRQRGSVFGLGILPFTGTSVLGWLTVALAAVGLGALLLRARRTN
jgi:hypothetical protein